MIIADTLMPIATIAIRIIADEIELFLLRASLFAIKNEKSILKTKLQNIF